MYLYEDEISGDIFTVHPFYDRVAQIFRFFTFQKNIPVFIIEEPEQELIQPNYNKKTKHVK